MLKAAELGHGDVDAHACVASMRCIVCALFKAVAGDHVETQLAVAALHHALATESSATQNSPPSTTASSLMSRITRGFFPHVCLDGLRCELLQGHRGCCSEC